MHSSYMAANQKAYKLRRSAPAPLWQSGGLVHAGACMYARCGARLRDPRRGREARHWQRQLYARGACCCAQLLDALAKNSALTSLDLSGNSIGEEGAQVGPRPRPLHIPSTLGRLDGGVAALSAF
jgi:hypothetical protein